MEKRLDYILKIINDRMSENRAIDELIILHLTGCIINLIINNESVELPELFDEVFEKLRSYWLYSAYNDCDKEVSFSYVRVYQTINMYKVLVNHKKYVADLTKASKKFAGEYELIKLIYDNSGDVTYQDLCERLNVSSDELKRCTEALIKQGFIYISRVGNFKKFYSISNSGIDLFNLLSGKEVN